MNERRLHPFTVLRFLRKTLVVYLLPLVQVLFERNWTALHTALRQDALLFLLLCAVSWGILRVSSWSMDDTGVFHLHWRLGIRLDRALRGEMLAALTIDRPLLYRMAGASRLTLYPVGAAQKQTLSVCLPKADAEAVADQLMPLVKPTLHRPAGGERAALGFLGANGLSTLALFVLAVRQTRDVPDWNPAVFAQIQVSFLARFAARWLPAGAAWLLAAAGFLLGASLMRSFAQTVHYTVWHTADQIGSRGGWLGHFECRVRTSEISFADVRISPAARLMKRFKNLYLITHFRQISGTGQSCRTGTDHRHLFRTLFFGLQRFHTIFRSPIRHKTFQLSDGYRIALDSKDTFSFALAFLRTYPSADCRKG